MRIIATGVNRVRMKSTGYSRRKFLQDTTRALLLTALPVPVSLSAVARSPNRMPLPHAPLSPLEGAIELEAFNGDDVDFPHEIFWNKHELLSKYGGIPEVSESADVVIIGGGIAGLTAAYRLRDFGPLVLEGAAQMGGNAKGEIWNGVSYSMGSAYVARPDEGDPTYRLLNDLGLFEKMRDESHDGLSVSFNGEVFEDFWSGATDPANTGEFHRVRDRLLGILENEFPDIPHEPGSALSLEELQRLDSVTFRQWWMGEFGELHPHVEEFLEMYCWTSFAAEAEHLSAAQVLNFLCSDMGGILTLPGGNAAIAQRLFDRLADSGGADRLRARTYVLDVRPDGQRVRITTMDRQGRLRSIRARACVVACPKFVAQTLIEELPEWQRAAMRGISYQAYLVGNVLIEGGFESPGYDLFRLEGRPPGDPRQETRRRPYCDYVCAGWAAGDEASHTALTLYRPLPYHGARQFLYNPFAYGKNHELIEEFLPELERSLGISRQRMKTVRLTRWGHALPLAYNGLIAQGRPMVASAPVAERIFFANQDNLASPCIENSIGEAQKAADSVRALLS